MAELGFVLVGFVCGVIFGVFISAIIAASSRDQDDISVENEIKKQYIHLKTSRPYSTIDL